MFLLNQKFKHQENNKGFEHVDKIKECAKTDYWQYPQSLSCQSNIWQFIIF